MVTRFNVKRQYHYESCAYQRTHVCIQIKSNTDEDIHLEYGSTESVTHPLKTMVGSEREIYEENVKICPDFEAICSAARGDE